MNEVLRQFPAVHELLALPSFRSLIEEFGRDVVTQSLRHILDKLRKSALQGINVAGQLNSEQLSVQIRECLIDANRLYLQPVINATGIMLHTNLGRAPLAQEALDAAVMAGEGYLNLELDLNTGKRSHRSLAVRSRLMQLLHCASATVVNNNAAATVIALRALARGKEVIVSRGELVEIGGSFRIPDIMAVSGAILKEVGTTNITRISDYEKAVTDNTALLLRVHASNYRIEGHTEAPSLEELVSLGRKMQLPVLDDIGSGALIDMKTWGLHDEPLARESLETGADLVMFSGDKLLGGPQAGILAGRADLIQKIESDPLMRAFRVDKMTLAALEATLRLYANPDKALEQIPLLQMLETPLALLQERAYALARFLGNVPGLAAHVITVQSMVGGGSLPGKSVESAGLAIRSEQHSAQTLSQRLRQQQPAILGRIENDQLILDLRTVPPARDQQLLEMVQQANA